MQDASGGEYTQFGNMMKVLASHEADDLNVTVYKQIWNEPDLTSYFNYTAGGTTFFHGTNADYNSMYESAATAMAVSSILHTVFLASLFAPYNIDQLLCFCLLVDRSQVGFVLALRMTASRKIHSRNTGVC